MKPIRLILGIPLGLLSVGMSLGQTVSDSPTNTQPEVSFHFERPGLSVPKFTLSIHEDGSATYKAEDAPVSSGSMMVQPVAAKPIDRAIRLTQPTVAAIFKAARSLDHFNIECASKAKNIADTGKKTLSYSGPDAQGSCTYNFSENKTVTWLTDTFQAIAFTMDEGRRLDFLHRYDRLGLDAEMENLAHEYEQKRALELGTISPTLVSLANDDAVMQRVRTRATRLLEQIDDKK
jgi:hypothetical protein